MTMQGITVTIITRDAAQQIAAACQSVAWAAEVLVLDCGSHDQTVAVAQQAGARTVIEPWQGYGPQKNRAAELAKNDWLLSLDADERCSVTLADAIAALPDRPDPAAFTCRRRNYFAGRAIRHWPWAWDRVVRLYDRRRGRFTTRQVHESILCDGLVGRLAGTLEHYSYQGWQDYQQRQQLYAQLAAQEARDTGRRPTTGGLVARPLLTLLRHYLVRGWLLGGRQGWQLSLAAARGTALRERLLRQLCRGSSTAL